MENRRERVYTYVTENTARLVFVGWLSFGVLGCASRNSENPINTVTPGTTSSELHVNAPAASPIRTSTPIPTGTPNAEQRAFVRKISTPTPIFPYATIETNHPSQFRVENRATAEVLRRQVDEIQRIPTVNDPNGPGHGYKKPTFTAAQQTAFAWPTRTDNEPTSTVTMVPTPLNTPTPIEVQMSTQTSSECMYNPLVQNNGISPWDTLRPLLARVISVLH